MTENSRDRCLLVFAKAPVLGHVKTRLQPIYSPQQSVDLHTQLVNGCLLMAATVSDCVTELWVGSAHHGWSDLSHRYQFDILQQQGEDLGDRMLHAFQQTLTTAPKAILIGTDCPFITRSYLLEAFDKLDECGYSGVSMTLKSDLELSMLSLRRAIALRRKPKRPWLDRRQRVKMKWEDQDGDS